MGLFSWLFGRKAAKPAAGGSARDSLIARTEAQIQAMLDAAKLLNAVKSSSDFAQAARKAADRLDGQPNVDAQLISGLRGMSQDARSYSDDEARTTARRLGSKLSDSVELIRQGMAILKKA